MMQGTDLASGEEELVRPALDGELEAFNQLIDRYQGLAYSVAHRLLDDPDAAADAVQDGFLKAFRGLEQYRGSSFKNWLMRIVTNTCYDVLRVRRWRPTQSLDGMEVDEPDGLRLVDPQEGPSDHAERLELNRILEEGIRALPDDQQVALILRDVHGYSYEEIAEITEATMGTVKSRINRARARMRDYLVHRWQLHANGQTPADGLAWAAQ